MRELFEMRRLVFVVLSLAVLLPKSGWTGSDENPMINQKIPPLLSRYYRDYNFVSSFSSASERALLVSFLSRKELPGRLKSERLEKIHKLLRQLDARVMSADPGIVFPNMPPIHYIVRPELIKINGAKRHNDEIMIRAYVYEIDPGTNFRLISQYNEYGRDEKKIPSEEQRIQMARSKFAPRKEIHKWILTGGKWIKEEVNILLLEDRK